MQRYRGEVRPSWIFPMFRWVRCDGCSLDFRFELGWAWVGRHKNPPPIRLCGICAGSYPDAQHRVECILEAWKARAKRSKPPPPPPPPPRTVSVGRLA